MKNTKGNKDHKIIHTTTVCHILDGINEYNTLLVLTKDKTKYPKRSTFVSVCCFNTIHFYTDLKGVKISSCKLVSCM